MWPRSRPSVYIFPSGTLVENTHQKRCHTISMFPLGLILEHSPQNQENQRKWFAFTLCDEQSVNCSFYSPTECSRPSLPSCLMKDVSSAASSRCAHIPAKVCTRFELFLAQRSQFASIPSNLGMPMVFLVSRMPPASAACCKGLDSDSLQPLITSSRSCERATEEDETSCFHSNSATTKFHAALSRLRCHV